MDGEATVRITAIECDIARAGFDEPFHRVCFDVACGDMEPVTFPIWVHGVFPRTEIAAIARTFLAAALRELAEAASSCAELDDEDAGALAILPQSSPSSCGDGDSSFASPTQRSARSRR